jgi:hypothetical protein
MKLRSHLRRLPTILSLIFLCILVPILLTNSILPPADHTEKVRSYTRNIEFDYVAWMIDAFSTKLDQLALGTDRYFPARAHHAFMLKYLRIVTTIQGDQHTLLDIYSDPKITDPSMSSVKLRAEINQLQQQQKQMAPIAEGILQLQVSAIVDELGLTLGGQPLPPVLYHTTPLPWALIVSPRDIIRQDDDISLLPDLTVDKFPGLETQVEKTLNVSALVTPIGGVGVYPTMVEESDDLEWLSEVVSHEWTHNYLTLRPLGISYDANPAMRIINETTANISGNEIGLLLLKRYYPELVPAVQPTTPGAPENNNQPPAFDFYQEMRRTRVAVDEYLAQGQIERAEKYMETRRAVFWENGYHLRRLNQAYFAFHGAYADNPSGGAAGADPVGAAVRQLRAQSPSLAVFLNRISWMASFQQLQQALRR